MQYKIGTNYGEWYVIDGEGHVLKRGGFDGSYVYDKIRLGYDLNSWIITGFWKYTHFGRVEFLPLEAIDRITDWLLKDNTPRYGLTDIDHGTHRLHGNKRYHGVRWVQQLE